MFQGSESASEQGAPKTFVLRKHVAGKYRNITIGRYSERLTLAEARKKARRLLSDFEFRADPAAVIPKPQKQMTQPDLNLLHTLDVLLSEGSVVRAGRRLQLSPSAMSRALARLRVVTGDQLLVRAGRGLVPTPRAMAMRQKVRELVEEAHVLLRPADRLELATLERTFTLRTSDGFAETFGPSLIERVGQEAPAVRLRFVRKLDKNSEGLRDGSVDLETGVVAGTSGPEIRAKALFVDRYVGVVRTGHPLARGNVDHADYAAASHVVAWRHGLDLGGVDELLGEQAFARNIVATADSFSTALALASGSDLVATVPERHTRGLRDGMIVFPIPSRWRSSRFRCCGTRGSMAIAHRRLRDCVLDACRA